MSNIEHELKVMEIAAGLVKTAIEQGQVDIRKLKEPRKIERLAMLTTLLKVHLIDSCMHWYDDENQDEDQNQDDDDDDNDENQDENEDDEDQDQNEDSEGASAFASGGTSAFFADEENDDVIPVEIIAQTSENPDKINILVDDVIMQAPIYTLFGDEESAKSYLEHQRKIRLG